MFWGACNAFTGKNCDYSWKTIVSRALDSINISTIRKFARKCDRYIDAYREKDGGVRLTAAQVEHAVKKYKSNRATSFDNEYIMISSEELHFNYGARPPTGFKLRLIVGLRLPQLYILGKISTNSVIILF
jgi:hypothetical protein